MKQQTNPYVNKENYLNLIRKAKPFVSINACEFIESGCHSLAVIVNKDLIFRFPLKRAFYQEYRQEKKILDILSSKVNTSVPCLTLHEIDDFIFTEHRLIHGEQYSRLNAPLTKDQKKVLAEDLAIFLTQMHAVQMDLPVEQFSAEDYGLNIANAKDCPSFCNRDIAKLEAILSDFESLSLSDKDIVLCHTDLNENNFLLQNGKLSGVIDFGNACRRDVSSEFSALLKWDFELVQMIISQYEKKTGKSVSLKYAVLLQKIRCYGGILEDNQNSHRVQRYRKWLHYLEQIQ